MPTQSDSLFTVLTPVVSGFAGTVIIGVLVPMIAAFVIDALCVLMGRRDPRPLLIVIAATVLALAFGVWALRLSASVETSQISWVLPALALFWLTGGVSIVQALRRTAADWQPPLPDADVDPVQLVKPRRRIRAISAKGGAALVVDWMRSHGGEEIEILPAVGDEAAAIRSLGHFAHVWDQRAETPVNALRELFGLAEAKGLEPLYFSAAGYSDDALTFARLVQMPLFDFHAGQSIVSAANPPALELLHDDLREEAADLVG